jgi:hypothetical protein
MIRYGISEFARNSQQSAACSLSSPVTRGSRRGSQPAKTLDNRRRWQTRKRRLSGFREKTVRGWRSSAAYQRPRVIGSDRHPDPATRRKFRSLELHCAKQQMAYGRRSHGHERRGTVRHVLCRLRCVIEIGKAEHLAIAITSGFFRRRFNDTHKIIEPSHCEVRTG